MNLKPSKKECKCEQIKGGGVDHHGCPIHVKMKNAQGIYVDVDLST